MTTERTSGDSGNTLYYGDNLAVLREHVPDESVDLVYLDPPFNSNASYNVLFKERTGEESPAQIKAFTDTWDWTQEAQRTYEDDIIRNPAVSAAVKEMITAFRQFIGSNAMMAYLVMMAPRLAELHRVLKPTGSIYLHCDPTASHYLKVLMDTVFGKQNFRNEIIWRRTGSHNQSRRYGPIHDVLLFYSKSDDYRFNVRHRPVTSGHVDSYFKKQDAKGRYWTNAITGAGQRSGDSGKSWRGYNPTDRGRHWAIPGALTRELNIPQEMPLLDKLEHLYQSGYVDLPPDGSNAMPTFRQHLQDAPGTPLQDIWAYQPYTHGVLHNTNEAIDEDVRWIPRQGSPERLGYQTQKPEGVLERIIRASSNDGDIVLDPFCGCGTAVAVAQQLERHWIGIDITHLAVNLMKNRLKKAFDIDPRTHYRVVGEPRDVGSARALWEQDTYEFQYWAMSMLPQTQLRSDRKKGADKGVDGLIHFVDGPQRTSQKVVVQVKGGHVSSPQIRDLKGTVEREKAAMGLFITLEEPTNPMRTEAVSAGYYSSDIWQRDYPKIQLRTVSELLSGQGFELPARLPAFEAAQRHREEAEQGRLG